MSISKLYEMALLSEASYANFELARNVDGTFDVTRVENALKDTTNDMKISQTQAAEFVDKWRVIEHQENTTFGFSATLFENSITGEKTLSIRGTERGDVADWYTDIVDIGVLGSTSSQEQYQDLKNFYQQLITDGKLGANETFSVAGHSLGGFLAQSFAIDFPLQVSSAYTYNAPGIGGGVLDALGISQDNIAVSNITNLIAEAGPEFVAGLGTMLGDVQNIFIEDQGLLGILDNHSISLMTDSLAIYNLFATLDPNLNTDPNGINTIAGFIENSTYINENSLETTLDMISGVFGVAGNVTVGDRESLYTQIQAIQGNTRFQAAAGFTSIVAVDSLSNAVMDDTVNGYAYRYALVNLNSFAVTGNPGLYATSEWSAENFTSEYLADRAYMLERLGETNALGIPYAPSVNNQSEYFYDYTSDTEVLTTDFASVMLGRTAPLVYYPEVRLTTNNYIFGDAENNTFVGGDLADQLYGGVGIDYIEGNDGADTISDGGKADTLPSKHYLEAA